MKCRVRAIIRRGDELLLVKHKNAQGLPYGTWVLPGGGIEEGESLVEALKREMIEEIGVEPDIGKLLFVHQFQVDNVFQGPEFLFMVKNFDDYDMVDLTKTTHGMQEIAEVGFHDPRTLQGVRPDFLKNIEILDSKNETSLMILSGENY